MQLPPCPSPFYFIKRLGYRIVFDNAVRRSKKVIVPSATVKKELIKAYGLPDKKVVVTYEGVDVKNISFKDSSSKNQYFIYAGNAYPHKNLERLIEAVVLMNKNSAQRINLLIASSRGIFTQRLEKIIREQKAGPLVSLLGFIPDNELFSLYKNSVGFVFPSLSEGFGLPGLEAMASRTILLSSDIPVFREIYGKEAVYFNQLEVTSIVQAMEKVLKMNVNLRANKIETAKNFVKRYSWTKMAEETLKIYAESSDSIRSGK